MNCSKVAILTAVFALGFSCILTQLALMREMLGVFAGNELVLGVVLGNWLLLMGLGASLGRRRWHPSTALMAGLLIVTAVLPPLQIIALRGLRHSLFLPGEAIGVVPTVVVSFLLLSPYCLTAGFLLALACSVLPARGEAPAAGMVYAMDSVGSLVGGVLFSFILVIWLDHAAMLVLPGVLNVLAAAWLAWERKGDHPRLAVVLCFLSVGTLAALPAWVFLAAPDAWSTARQFPGQRLLFKANSPYGRLVVTEAGGQTNVMENGVGLVSTPNIEQAEETAHLALAQRPDAKKVLLIGGTLSGAVREILRHEIAALDCIELDPLIIALGRSLFPAEFSDRRLRLHDVDARQFLRQSAGQYDAIIVALPDPTTAQINRFFTREFFEEVRRVLGPGGVISFAIGRYENFAGPELSRVLSCARQTALGSFRNVLLVPAGRVYLLASDTTLTTDFKAALDRSGVPTRWLTGNYFAATLSPDRLQDVERAASHLAPVNHDFAPALYYFHLRHWASQFDSTPNWILIVFSLGTAVYLLRLRPVARLILASGFAASALEVVLLLAVQTLIGSVYRQVAWVVTIFMAGLAVGAWWTTRQIDRSLPTPGGASVGEEIETKKLRGRLCVLGLCVAGFAVLVPALLSGLAGLSALSSGPLVAQVVILLLSFCLAGVVGAQFPLANAHETAKHPAAALYTADFVGASLGALVTSTWLLPAFGVAGVCWITAGLNGIAALLVFRTRAFA
jgi:spermidine synthase